MPSIELRKLQAISAPRAVSGSDRAQIDTPTAHQRSAAAQGKAAGVKIEVGTAVEAGEPPINNERVAEIREALKDGSYPLVPTEIADAMIAARLGFGIE
ncbi:flagellar biosynthesis anti-sigma factor FlgM [Erythrobacter sp. THAF29]|uniref:flagellar biosynthesis anti-sigma factor FlgM n=1 Tax=Erythrobacter sp. THAF29 TaxID=2587851 RepID=UPI0012688F7C|nr:flagellar biosynthesis anti-sigma factor FlgM [Erythrobacter sp. THAF29]QFT76682.1 Anti-sigma-28 factor, FlgM [Erythrobacter sp. THAF29]